MSTGTHTSHKRWAVAVDIGGTKVAAAAFDEDGKQLTPIARRPLPPGGGEGAWQATEQAVTEILEAMGTRPVAIGASVAAVVDQETGVVIWAPNLPAWQGFPLASRLAARFGSRVRLDLDGHLAVLGEAWLGAGRGTANVAMMVVGTGIGGGVLVDGRLVRGAAGLAGTFGWMAGGPVGAEPYPGWQEKCRQVGWLESLAAGPAILARARHLAARARALDAPPPRGRSVAIEAGSGAGYEDTPAVFAAARAGDPIAVQVIRETGYWLGLAAANAASLFGSELFILGGGVGEQADLLIPYMQPVVEEHAQPYAARRLRLVPAALGNAAALAGAARLALETQRSTG